MRGFLEILLFFFNDTATTEIYTLSLHDALPISSSVLLLSRGRCELAYLLHQPRTLVPQFPISGTGEPGFGVGDRKSTRLNSSHTVISYAVFCLKKKS